MPELPEVETVRRAMAMHLTGKRIENVRSSGLPLRATPSRSRLLSLRGCRFTGARRRAKFLLLDLSDGRVLLVHLGMTGNLLFREETRLHDHIVFELDDGPPLVYADPRRFGTVMVLNGSELSDCAHLSQLGVEPLGEQFDADYLLRQCRGRVRPIKNLIMDARIVAGVGNIYASEALHRARIRPSTPAGRIGRHRLQRLVEAIRNVLNESIQAGGTTISDYQGHGGGGRFQQNLAVYGRAGANCLVCERPIESEVLAGRTTYFCRRCQR